MPGKKRRSAGPFRESAAKAALDCNSTPVTVCKPHGCGLNLVHECDCKTHEEICWRG